MSEKYIIKKRKTITVLLELINPLRFFHNLHLLVAFFQDSIFFKKTGSFGFAIWLTIPNFLFLSLIVKYLFKIDLFRFELYIPAIILILTYLGIKLLKRSIKKQQLLFSVIIEANYWEHAIFFLFYWFSFTGISIILYSLYYR